MRLIDADKAVIALTYKAKQAFERNGGTYDNVAAKVYKEAAELVDKLPTVTRIPAIDAVKHGSWEDVGFKDFMCSECGIILGGAYCYVYCPHCGTKMDGVAI